MFKKLGNFRQICMGKSIKKLTNNFEIIPFYKKAYEKSEIVYDCFYEVIYKL